jgi:hypothetical protein
LKIQTLFRTGGLLVLAALPSLAATSTEKLLIYNSTGVLLNIEPTEGNALTVTNKKVGVTSAAKTGEASYQLDTQAGNCVEVQVAWDPAKIEKPTFNLKVNGKDVRVTAGRVKMPNGTTTWGCRQDVSGFPYKMEKRSDGGYYLVNQ